MKTNKIIILFMFSILLILPIAYSDDEVESASNYPNIMTWWDSISNMFTGGWLVSPPAIGCKLEGKIETQCKAYTTSTTKFNSGTSASYDTTQWAFKSYNDASCTQIYRTISSGILGKSEISPVQSRPYSGKYYRFVAEQYKCTTSTTPITPPISVASCVDTDGGKVNNVKGTVTTDSTQGCINGCVDRCETGYPNAGKLIEFSCASSTKKNEAAYIICPSTTSCKDGACLGDVIPPVVTPPVVMPPVVTPPVINYVCCRNYLGVTSTKEDCGVTIKRHEGACTCEDYNVDKQCADAGCSWDGSKLSNKCSGTATPPVVTPPVVIPPVVTGCTADADCKNGETCKDKICTPIVTPPAPTCVPKGSIFYSDGYIKSSTATPWAFHLETTTSSGNIGGMPPSAADEVVVGFSSKYHETGVNACCEGFEPEFVSEQKSQTNSDIAPGIITYLFKYGIGFSGDDKIDLSYSIYKCVSGGDKEFEGFCPSFAISIGKGLGAKPGEECMYGWAMIALVVIIGGFILSKMMK